MIKFTIMRKNEIVGTIYGTKFATFGEDDNAQVEIYSKEGDLEVCLDFKAIEQDKKGNTYIYID